MNQATWCSIGPCEGNGSRFADNWRVKDISDKLSVVGKIDDSEDCFSIRLEDDGTLDIAFYAYEKPSTVYASLKAGKGMDASYHKMPSYHKHLGVTLPEIIWRYASSLNCKPQ